MTTTGTATTEFDFTELCEEAYERCGTEMRTGYDLRTARRSLNLLMMEWANRGLNFWTVDSGSIALVAGTATYNLPVDTIDLLEQVVRTGTGTSQSDYPLLRISAVSYAQQNKKNQQSSRPLQVWVDRQGGQTDPTDGVRYPQITLWPVPDSADYTFEYWRLRRLQDAGSAATTADMPFRFVPALVAGLAYYLAQKIPEASDRVAYLEEAYEKQFQMASEEDRDKSDFRIIPRIGR